MPAKRKTAATPAPASDQTMPAHPTGQPSAVGSPHASSNGDGWGLLDHYDAFVSHNHQQKEAARHLVGHLREHWDVFFDVDSVPLSTKDLLALLKEAIARSDRVLMLLSPAAAASTWVAMEAYEAVHLANGGNGPELMVLELEPTPDRLLPEFIKRKPRLNLTAVNADRDHAFTSLLQQLGFQVNGVAAAPLAPTLPDVRQRITLIFDVPREQWSNADEDAVIQFIKSRGAKTVDVKAVRKGSTIVELEVDALDVEALMQSVRAGQLRNLKLREVHVTDLSGAAIADYVEPSVAARQRPPIPPEQEADRSESIQHSGGAAAGAGAPVALFQRAHAFIVKLQRLDAQLSAVIEQRRLLQDDLGMIQAQINDELDRVMREADEAPARILSETASSGEKQTAKRPSAMTAASAQAELENA